MKKKIIKIYLDFFEFFIIIASFLFMCEILNKFNIPSIFDYLYYIFHILSFVALLYYRKHEGE